MKKILILSSLIGLCGLTNAETAPFGIAKGTTIEQLIKMGAIADKNAPGFYILRKVPKPNSSFSEYMIIAGKKNGVCAITAITDNFINDSSGYKLKDAFLSLEFSLNTIYGLGEKYDTIRPSSLWTDANDWMMSIKTEDRILREYWNKKLPKSISGIQLSARGASSTEGYITLGYQFVNFDSCIREIKGNPNNGL